MKINKIISSLVLAATAISGFAVTPAFAHGHDRDRYYDRGEYRDHDRDYRYDRYDRYDRRDYRDRRYYNNRCSNGTGGTIIGAVAGGLVGDRVARRGSRTEGTIIGAAIGALGGRALDKASSRCR